MFSASLNICVIFDRETRQTLFQEKGKIGCHRVHIRELPPALCGVDILQNT